MDDIILNNKTAFYYSLIGLGLLFMSLRPAFEGKAFMNVPLVYIIVGALAASIGLPMISPMGSELETLIVERVSELIVIISLAGAGLAIDTKIGLRSWGPTWRLIGIAMPLCIIAIAVLGWQVAGLGAAASVLLGAALAPTDPVLARAVQVGAPGENEADGTGEGGAEVALTSEAGLNDGLAFPFVWLAIGLAGVVSVANFDWTTWVLYDVLWRTAAGIIVGIASGWVITKVLYSPLGDATNESGNPVLVLLAATFISYGAAEFIHGYGFLSVFIAARAGRRFADDPETENYERKAHNSADQIEAVLMAILLLWFGAYVGGELWSQWTWTDLLIAGLIIIVVRPVLAFIALLGACRHRDDAFKIAFFGIRGMGSIFYIAYAQTHADIAGIEEVWRIAGLTILLSAIIHGTLAEHLMKFGEDTVATEDASKTLERPAKDPLT